MQLENEGRTRTKRSWWQFRGRRVSENSRGPLFHRQSSWCLVLVSVCSKPRRRHRRKQTGGFRSCRIAQPSYGLSHEALGHPRVSMILWGKSSVWSPRIDWEHFAFEWQRAWSWEKIILDNQRQPIIFQKTIWLSAGHQSLGIEQMICRDLDLDPAKLLEQVEIDSPWLCRTIFYHANIP